MNKLAYVFPGQGSQYVGMGKDIYNDNSKVQDIFSTANSLLGKDLSKLCFEGPEEELKITYNTQPAILTTSYALYELAKKQLPNPDYVAGHSLGEYTALVISGVMPFADAVVAVQKRGEFMDSAVPAGVGAMAAVLGGDKDTIQRICEQVSYKEKIVQIANINCPGQIVISGHEEKVVLATEKLKESGIKRVIPLVVSGPFHSKLMEPASEKLKEEVLNSINMMNTVIPVVANVSAKEITSAEEIKNALVEQVYSSVLWEDSIRYMIQNGVDTFIEIGPGKVLSGLIKKIDKSVNVYSISDIETMNNVIEKLKQVGGNSNEIRA
ncbi:MULTISPECIES: ACP S-malonyltransferase [Bacillus cereus group]|uniref:Malonyl CoA-acyl carrier protein transacylase n=1 Tax=Bacillus thuringiensis TaxID=1428 RepID=A0A9X6WFN2_BACTU|nr:MULTISPECIES: ACP S-malonyltransferase [Bacillus cereus group]PFJ25967.1 [acyl-carrier-protein] S-malonyltransferase [Bacillus thuringiensis]PGP11553.1 [acyl-carrier-protein] S-malonyltransferase [Bacillus cereus]